jgi:hypothetical protein
VLVEIEGVTTAWDSFLSLLAQPDNRKIKTLMSNVFEFFDKRVIFLSIANYKQLLILSF